MVNLASAALTWADGRAPQPSNGLVSVSWATRSPRCALASPFTFGRGYDRTLRFGHDSVHGRPDLHISRHAGSIRYGGGLSVVCKDSDSRPLVIVRGYLTRYPPNRVGLTFAVGSQPCGCRKPRFRVVDLRCR
jgi:hypothetical protein